MDGFIKSFAPILKQSRKYFLEIIILSVALIITIIAVIIYIKNNQDTQTDTSSPTTFSIPTTSKIFVDLSGAVKKPGLYEIEFGARLKDIIDKGDGLSDEADTTFFQQNFNLAQVVTDQEKIYIPSILEINNGVFIQNQRTLDYLSPGISSNKGVINDAPTTENKININSATIDELDQLPGIGQATANKIITNRPYTTIDDLITKKVVSKSVFDNIKGQISL